MGWGRRPNDWPTLEKRLVSTPSGCLEWRGGVDRGGYGKTRVRYRHIRLHRYAWESLRGPIPDGISVLHRCDNRRCANVEHLFLGTAGDNLRDMFQKRRHWNAGGGIAPRRLTRTNIEAVRALAAAGLRHTTIAKQLGLNGWTVKEIVNGHLHTGAARSNATITLAQASDIKRRLLAGFRQIDITRLLGLSRSLVQGIARGRSWRNVEPRLPTRTPSEPEP